MRKNVLNVEMHKGHASYAHSKQGELSLDVVRGFLESGTEHANVMYRQNVEARKNVIKLIQIIPLDMLIIRRLIMG